ncbi:MAG: BadF/BadG/BcrA/BcrD ATPase family protein [Thermofilaceae archaeon]
MAGVFVGVDGGATKTLSVAADNEGEIIGIGEAGPSNYHSVGLDVAVENINSSIRLALADAKLEVADVVVLGLAGMDTLHDFRFFEEKAAPKIAGKRVYVRHDAEIALVGATMGQPGVIVIAGTGSVAGARNRRGEYARCGGWGNLVGDEGSAYYIAIEALREVLRAFDGRSEPTALMGEILKALSIDSPDEILRKLYVEKMSTSDVARLAPSVTRLAMQGDRVALKIIERAAEQLALHVIALVKRLGMLEEQPVKVAVVGGVFKAGRVILDPFEKKLKEQLQVEIIRPEFPPAVGALILAYTLSNVELTGKIMQNLRQGVNRFNLKL